HLLAAHPWPALYDAARLADNRVPAAAAIYTDDMYVAAEFSELTAAAVNGLRPWRSEAHQHSALRTDGAAILDRLITLARS
ncbi:MAG TPA: hypothetical protein VHV79_09715, partial [Mycobacteriales bacterium]|nr:hypothetical protein [Mycobacteriales bacterium]